MTLVSFLTFAFVLIDKIVSYGIKTFLSFWIFEFIFGCIFAYFIIKRRYYRHHYFSIITMIIFFIIINVINEVANINYLKLFLKLLNYILYSLNIIIKTYILYYTYCYASELVSYEGIITLFLYIITLIISTKNDIKNDNCKYTVYNGKCYFDNFFAYYKGLNTKEVFIFLIVLVYYSIYHLLFYAIIREIDIFYTFLIIIFKENILYDIFLKYNETKKNDKWKLYINLIIFLILFFMLLVFNEIIEIIPFELSRYTRRNILPRPCPACQSHFHEDHEEGDNEESELKIDFDTYEIESNNSDEKKDL